jgi:hypothetical protein
VRSRRNVLSRVAGYCLPAMVSDAGDMGSTQARDGCSGLKNGLRQGHDLSIEGSRPLRKQLRGQTWALISV